MEKDNEKIVVLSDKSQWKTMTFILSQKYSINSTILISEVTQKMADNNAKLTAWDINRQSSVKIRYGNFTPHFMSR